MSSRYTVLLYPAETCGFVATVPMFGLATEGETVEHALAMANEAVELRIEALVRDGEPVLDEEHEPIVAAILGGRAAPQAREEPLGRGTGRVQRIARSWPRPKTVNPSAAATKTDTRPPPNQWIATQPPPAEIRRRPKPAISAQATRPLPCEAK